MVWNRTHVETLAPDEGAFQPVAAAGVAPGLAIRLLSKDESDGALTALLRIPPGWRQEAPFAARCTLEAYVIEGGLTVGDLAFRQGWYTYRPAGFRTGPIHSAGGALLLLFTYGRFALGEERETAGAIPGVDTETIPWGKPLTDKKDSPLLSKSLRIDPETGERVFLNRLLEPAGDPRIEWHPCVEELYQLEGTTSMDYPRNRFLLAPGVYCYRPPNIPHGPFQTDGPVLTLIRVSSTLINYYVSPEEAERMIRAYGPGIDPRMLEEAPPEVPA
jgi:mannose-6-phosphate isomerase-like protein (cupin superfamily)